MSSRYSIILFTLIFGIVPKMVLAAVYEVAAGSSLSYFVEHPMHDVEGVNLAPKGTFSYDPEHPLVVQKLLGAHIEALWSDFSSGNDSRDANVIDTVGGYTYPKLYFVIRSAENLEQITDKVTATLIGDLYINGQKREQTVPIEVTFLHDQQLHVTSEFDILMTDFGIQPPSLLFVSAKDMVHIKVDLNLVQGTSVNHMEP